MPEQAMIRKMQRLFPEGDTEREAQRAFFYSAGALLISVRPLVLLRLQVTTYLLLASCGCALAVDLSFEAQGSIDKIDASGSVTRWTEFTVWVSGRNSMVSNLFFNGEVLMNGSDGTNSFFLNKMAVAKQSDSSSWEWGNVSPGSFPAKDLTPGQLCWLGYASGVLVHGTDPPALPLEAFQQNAASYRTQIDFSGRRPNLPRRITWLGPNSWHLGNNPQREPLKLPYTNGFLAGEFLVTSVTNLSGWEIPTAFEASFFIPFFKGTGFGPEQVSLVELLRGRLRSVRRIDNLSDPRPPLGPKAQIHHYELSAESNRYISLTRFNSKWPTKADQDFQRAVEVAKLSKKGSSGSGTRFAYLARWGVIMVALGSLALFWKVVRKTRNETNS